MTRNAALIFVISSLLPLLVAWETLAARTDTVRILPQDCTIRVGEQLSLTLEGDLPSDVKVRWDADSGAIISVLPGRDALFFAPSSPATVTVSVSLSPGVPGMETRITRQCLVTSLHSAPRGLAQTTGTDSLGTVSFSLQLNAAAD
jgi:hypothetical protein